MTDDWKKKINQIQKNKFFCPRPFVEIISNNKEKYGPCCYSNAGMPSNQGLDDQRPFDWFAQGDDLQALRAVMLGKQDNPGLLDQVCGFCRVREAQNITSPRQTYIERFLRNLVEGEQWSDADMALITERIVTWSGHEPWTTDLGTVAVRMRLFGNYCNLRCVSCGPNSSSQIQTEYKKIIKLEPGSRLRAMGIVDQSNLKISGLVQAQQNVIDNIDKVRSILLIGGEPLLTPGHFEWLDKIVASGHAGRIELRYQTNLTEMHRYANRIFQYKQHFQRIFFIGSIDSFEHRNDYVRWGSTWSKLMENIGLVQTQGLGLTINITTTWLTSLWVGPLWDHLHRTFGIDAEINGSVVNRPTHLRPRHLPQEFKETALNHLEYYVKDPLRYQVLAQELAHPQDPRLFKLGIEYLETLDRSRKANWLAVFPEFKPHAHK